MKTWRDDISSGAQETLRLLGNFGPLDAASSREIKGWMADFEDGGVIKTYLTSSDLREMALHLVEVADWLDNRAAA